jgi:16S rRNA (guanine966-N2)-methyltransferase
MKRPVKRRPGKGASQHEPATTMRVIGGKLRGRQFDYSGDPTTRPMKDRVREAVFNLLGTDVQGKWAIDLFAGTGALAFEALSRGSVGATLIERHFPTAKLLTQNAEKLGLTDQVQVVTGSSLLWGRSPDAPPSSPWLVFCSPPYAMYVDQRLELLELLKQLLSAGPQGTMLVIESDERFSPDDLPASLAWDVRQYPPAQVAIGRPLAN